MLHEEGSEGGAVFSLDLLESGFDEGFADLFAVHFFELRCADLHAELIERPFGEAVVVPVFGIGVRVEEFIEGGGDGGAGLVAGFFLDVGFEEAEVGVAQIAGARWRS